ncbi:sulfate transporter CysZ [Actinobacillus pleuropneumoniae]|uniref:Sulfate transporter CysZ n=3 Tax=Actinobacillus pleuropneumoniae TaxID=715 RepID=A0A223MC01_ACTPL|nr:sulfate transporter CysZ [Actinobacillus pleuropneumoniae]ASU15135.1 Sulfate transporter CysZ [Actinobacillus pleuropneumoniae]AWG95734.1 sulfate transporter CysZ [Actinobacillus pleuropneumoniae serovar 1 str. 4074]AXA21804.1 sulfate transporter CysZ [Actinobacillus pleuropneumoniae]EFL79234.1 putative sulfate transport protein CysZ [Actinobacillus pleuropneumoniae serovar 2 str. 4226]EFL80761.1 putative sulfate transport protein CysZ [Actinobacillus pleuropneumoniae serovar 6 str. Femo]
MSSAFNEPQSELGLGFHYFIYGWRLMLQRRLMPFVLIPVAINAVLMIALLWFFISHIAGWADWIVSFMPSWLDWLTMILVPLAVLSLIMLFYFTFTTITNFIAAPFNALLAEKVELQLTGEQLNNMTVAEMLKDVPRMLKREWQKMAYSIPRFIALFLLSFVPVVGQTVVPVLTFVFGAWLLAIQYCDYPFDNHKISFKRMRNALGQRKILNFTFGTFVSIFTALPFVNLVVMPVAVCGATAMWVEEYRNFMLGKTSDFDGADYTTKTGREVSTETRSGAVNPNVRNGNVKPH